MGSQNRYEGFDPYAVAIIRRKARQLGRELRCEPLDIEQELAVELLVGLRRHDPQKLPRHIFISEILENKSATIVHHWRAQKRNQAREECSLNEPPLEKSDDPSLTFGDTLDSDIGRAGLSPEDLSQLQADLDVVMKSMTDREQRVVEALLEEPNVRRAARKLGVHHTAVYEDIRHIHERFKKADLQDYLRKRPTHPGRLRY